MSAVGLWLRQFISCTREDKGNRMNFTYVVYKLIELYGSKKEKNILKYIHLQSADGSKKTRKNLKENMPEIRSAIFVKKICFL